jgi:hypothetical protein
MLLKPLAGTVPILEKVILQLRALLKILAVVFGQGFQMVSPLFSAFCPPIHTLPLHTFLLWPLSIKNFSNSIYPQ